MSMKCTSCGFEDEPKPMFGAMPDVPLGWAMFMVTRPAKTWLLCAPCKVRAYAAFAPRTPTHPVEVINIPTVEKIVYEVSASDPAAVG